MREWDVQFPCGRGAFAISIPILRGWKYSPAAAATTAKCPPPSSFLAKVKRRDGTFAPIDKVRGFIDYHRYPDPYRNPLERVTDWAEINSSGHGDVERTVQAARCMDCGTPFCQVIIGIGDDELDAVIILGEWSE